MMCNLSEGIYERGMSQGMSQGMARGAENKLIEVIMNLWNAGTDMATIKIASGWTEEQTKN